MDVRYSQSFLIWLFVTLNLLAPAAPAAPIDPVVPVTAADPKKLVEQAEIALDQDDLVEAMKLYRQAAEQNDLSAQVKMGQFADSSQFYEEAVGWFLMAAMQGNAPGQFNLGKMYMTGDGIEKDPAKALYWTNRAAAQNFTPAVKVMAAAYHSGGFNGLVKIDLDQAKLWDSKLKRLEAIETKAIQQKLDELAASRKKLLEEEAAKRGRANSNNK